MNDSALRTQQWRLVRRARSREVRISFHAGKGSLTQGEMDTLIGQAIRSLNARSSGLSVLMTGCAHDVWFRLLKDELSLRCDYRCLAQRRNCGYRRLFGKYWRRKLATRLTCSEKQGRGSISRDLA